MPKGLWFKFLLLLLSVAIIGLSATLLLRELMVRDFSEYLEGEMLDRVYRMVAALESSYITHAGWDAESVAENVVLARMMGVEIRLYDEKGALISDTGGALEGLPGGARKRVLAVTEPEEVEGDFTPYGLFWGGAEIGRLEARFSRTHKELVYIRRSNRLLLLSVLALGGIAVLLSVIFSRRMTRPVKELTSAASAISEGNLTARVSASGTDEMGKLSEAFNRMAENLLKQESLRKKLTTDIAHELRTPLSAVRGELEGMMDGLIPVDKDALRSLYAETGRLASILGGIEELSQAEASGLSIRKHPLEAGPFLRNIIERFRKPYADKDVSLGLSSEEGLGLLADPDKLSQIIINLLSNALKATGRGGAVHVKASSAQGGTAIEVADTGQGIKEEDLPFIFERFYRGEKGGLGIGLTIVKELVEAHGGKVETRSKYGKGSTFTVYLPT
jgi:two-component system sensor histidine kinase BaeS